VAREKREYEEGSLRQRLSDLFDHTSSLVLLALCVVLFGGAAVAGVAMVSRLGGVGWFMYAVVMGTFALVFGPVIASAVTLRQRGSKRHREEARLRVEEQRKKFGLTVRERERDEP
jgi:hypothetical protein